MALSSGKIVWAKMKHSPWWPSRILSESEVPKNLKKSKLSTVVWFFGTENVGMVKMENILPFLDKKIETMIKCNTIQQHLLHLLIYVEGKQEYAEETRVLKHNLGEYSPVGSDDDGDLEEQSSILEKIGEPSPKEIEKAGPSTSAGPSATNDRSFSDSTSEDEGEPPIQGRKRMEGRPPSAFLLEKKKKKSSQKRNSDDDDPEYKPMVGTTTWPTWVLTGWWR